VRILQRRGDETIWPGLTEEQVKGMCPTLVTSRVLVDWTEGGGAKGAMQGSPDGDEVRQLYGLPSRNESFCCTDFQ